MNLIKTIEMKNTTENNKLIAEFMGARVNTWSDGTKGHTFWNEEGVEGRSGRFPDGSTNYFEYEKGYHISWDWLMPVVEKISKDFEEKKNFPMYNQYLLEAGTEREDFLIFRLGKEELYKAVVEFIKCYNKQDKS